MCLSKIKFKGKAKRDIVCYKHLRVVDGFEGSELYTSYMNMRVNIGETYTSNIHQRNTGGSKTIIREALHSFQRLNSVKKDIEGWFTCANFVYVECIIPKDSIYYEGKQPTGRGYASNCLKIVKVIDNYEEKSIWKKFTSLFK